MRISNTLVTLTKMVTVVEAEQTTLLTEVIRQLKILKCTSTHARHNFSIMSVTLTKHTLYKINFNDQSQ